MRSRVSEEKEIQVENINNIDQGITKKLLEKYKSKVHYRLETLDDRKDQRKVS